LAWRLESAGRQTTSDARLECRGTIEKSWLLITGQNPASSGPAAKVLIDTLKAR